MFKDVSKLLISLKLNFPIRKNFDVLCHRRLKVRANSIKELSDCREYEDGFQW